MHERTAIYSYTNKLYYYYYMMKLNLAVVICMHSTLLPIIAHIICTNLRLFMPCWKKSKPKPALWQQHWNESGNTPPLQIIIKATFLLIIVHQRVLPYLYYLSMFFVLRNGESIVNSLYIAAICLPACLTHHKIPLIYMQLVLTSREISRASETGVAGGKGDIGWCKMWEIPVNM